jgi:hypothetical protein
MGKAKPKMIKNLSSLYQVFMPNNKRSLSRKKDLIPKNKSTDETKPEYYVTFNKDKNAQ